MIGQEETLFFPPSAFVLSLAACRCLGLVLYAQQLCVLFTPSLPPCASSSLPPGVSWTTSGIFFSRASVYLLQTIAIHSPPPPPMPAHPRRPPAPASPPPRNVAHLLTPQSSATVYCSSTHGRPRAFRISTRRARPVSWAASSMS